jgi:septum formation protein
VEKPTSTENAVEMLANLSGRAHYVLSGLILLVPSADGPKVFSFCETTEVVFTALTQETIKAYVATGSSMDKSGGYGIQDGIASSFVSKLNGCYFNVTGFPTFRFCYQLRELIENKTIQLM